MKKILVHKKSWGSGIGRSDLLGFWCKKISPAGLDMPAVLDMPGGKLGAQQHRYNQVEKLQISLGLYPL